MKYLITVFYGIIPPKKGGGLKIEGGALFRYLNANLTLNFFETRGGIIKSLVFWKISKFQGEGGTI